WRQGEIEQRQEHFAVLRAREPVFAFDDKRRHRIDSATAGRALGCGYFGDPRAALEVLARGCSVQTGAGGGPLPSVDVADINAVAEITVKQPLDHSVSATRAASETHQPVGVERAPRAADSLECKVDPLALPGDDERCERPRGCPPAAELGAQVEFVR